MKVFWSKQAEVSYTEILEFLEKKWTHKEIMSFRRLTNDILSKIETEQVDFPFVNKKMRIQKVVIHKNVSLYFLKRDSKVYLITFFDNRKNPETIRKTLK